MTTVPGGQRSCYATEQKNGEDWMTVKALKGREKRPERWGEGEHLGLECPRIGGGDGVWTFRTIDYSYHRLFVPWTVRTIDLSYHLYNLLLHLCLFFRPLIFVM